MKIGRKTQIVDCRETMGMGLGGGLAEKGTISEAEETEVIVLSMSPIARHVTKPVCEITYGLREAGLPVSVLVLEAGMGLPYDAPGGWKVQTSGITDKEIAQINRHKLAIIHQGNVPGHFIYKARVFLRHAEVPAIIVCQAPVTLEKFAEIGIKVRGIEGESETKGEIVDVVTGVIRGETCPAPKLEEIIRKVQYWLSVYS
ncbi:MAG: methyl-coenzyme M reductase I operon protein C [Halobacteriota archaeon]|nr:methyl-coenzyme M reductase I operon protein C [Halobacteriota archaeon]